MTTTEYPRQKTPCKRILAVNYADPEEKLEKFILTKIKFPAKKFVVLSRKLKLPGKILNMAFRPSGYRQTSKFSLGAINRGEELFRGSEIWHSSTKKLAKPLTS